MTAVDTAPTSTYRVTVLGTGLLRMWRGWRIIVPVVLLNAAIQGLLLLPGFLPYLTPAFVIAAVVGFVVLVAFIGITVAAMLQAVTGPVRLGTAVAMVRARALPLLGWTSALAIVTTLATSLYVLPGLVILALTPFLLLAVVDGQPHPLRTNVRVIGARWGRWLVTVLVIGVLGFVLWLLSALDGFFVTGAPAGFLGWIALGLAISWFTCAWALVYRSVVPDLPSTE